MLTSLEKNPRWKGRRGPLVLVIMDGVGYGEYKDGDAVANADMRHFRAMESTSPATKLKAHGTAVGLPSDEDMGNSEVGHNAIGCGRVFAQGAKLVGSSIETKAMFSGSVWKDLIANVLKRHGRELHFLAFFRDGNVHSHIDHLKAIGEKAASKGTTCQNPYPLDGRDVGSQSALDFVLPFEKFLAASMTRASITG